jgi:uncharacterized iron-regulated membrane protein
MHTPFAQPGPRRRFFDHVAVWQWHFYAGLFCMPFFCWLAVTGSLYLFRPDIEAWLDRPYEALQLAGPRAAPSSEARAALAALPGSTFDHYELPATPTGAAQVVVSRGGVPYRVYVHPQTLQPLKTVRDDERLMELVAHLHGELLLGTRGSMLVELAGSWGVVMIVTGLWLWLPRTEWRLGGLLYPRLGRRGRLFWRDLHGVAGLWISLVTLFLLLSGLPWSAGWGNYLTWVRNHWAATRGAPDWTIGGAAPAPATARTSALPRPAESTANMPTMPGMNAAEMAAMTPADAVVHHPVHDPAHDPAHHATHDTEGAPAAQDLRPLDVLAPLALRLQPAHPVWIAAPSAGGTDWSVSSHAQNRPQRVTYSIAPATGKVTATQGFADQNIVDRVVNVSVAAHEGQLFGRLNQALLLLNAIGVVLVTASGVVMWWRRRPAGTLGAPPLAAAAARPAAPAALVGSVLVLALVLPLFGLSLLVVLALERTLLQGLPAARKWLGLAPGGT